MFGLRRKRRKPENAIRLQDVGDPLSLIPLIAKDVEWLEHDGKIRARFMLADRNIIEKWSAKALGMVRNAELNLDPVGSTYWRLIDGRRNLRQIARTISSDFDFPEEKSREATVLFTRHLLMRGFITIVIKDQEHKAWRPT